jgi:hypothetical protein
MVVDNSGLKREKASETNISPTTGNTPWLRSRSKKQALQFPVSGAESPEGDKKYVASEGEALSGVHGCGR